MTRILVVDDSLLDIRIAKGLLEQQPDWEIIVARNGVEALEAIESDLPSIVVTDLQMPEMDGLELVERIRKQYPLIPVILMTSAGSEAIAVKAIEMGASSYVPKNQLANDLVTTATRLLATAVDNRVRRRLRNYLHEIRYVLQNDLELLSALSGELRQMVEELRFFDNSQCLRFANAVDEALLNAFYHGNLEVSSELRDVDADSYHDLAQQRRLEMPYCERRIHVTAHIDSENVTVTVRDEGPGFDPDALPDPTQAGFVERAYGRGLLLMRAFVDEVSFNHIGNEVKLVKRITRGLSEDES